MIIINKNPFIMTIHKLSNPHNFVKECKEKGITYDYLLEIINCIGHWTTKSM